MFRTPQGIRYPSLDETNISDAVRATLTDVQYLIDRLNARQSSARARKGFAVRQIAGQVIADSVTTAASYDTEVWDTGSYITVPGTTATLTRGLWLLSAFTYLSCAGNITSLYQVFFSAAAGSIAPNQLTTIGTSTANIATSTLFPIQGATDTVRLDVFKSSLGGGNGTFNSYLAATRIRTY